MVHPTADQFSDCRAPERRRARGSGRALDGLLRGHGRTGGGRARPGSAPFRYGFHRPGRRALRHAARDRGCVTRAPTHREDHRPRLRLPRNHPRRRHARARPPGTRHGANPDKAKDLGTGRVPFHEPASTNSSPSTLAPAPSAPPLPTPKPPTTPAASSSASARPSTRGRRLRFQPPHHGSPPARPACATAPWLSASAPFRSAPPLNCARCSTSAPAQAPHSSGRGGAPGHLLGFPYATCPRVMEWQSRVLMTVRCA